jgi:hypothetical protein
MESGEMFCYLYLASSRHSDEIDAANLGENQPRVARISMLVCHQTESAFTESFKAGEKNSPAD